MLVIMTQNSNAGVHIGISFGGPSAYYDPNPYYGPRYYNGHGRYYYYRRARYYYH